MVVIIGKDHNGSFETLRKIVGLIAIKNKANFIKIDFNNECVDMCVCIHVCTYSSTLTLEYLEQLLSSTVIELPNLPTTVFLVAHGRYIPSSFLLNKIKNVLPSFP